MANIRVDLDHELNNGQPVTFVAPCDCTAVTGLKVYHLGGSKVFTFKDAHGNTLTGIGNLFESGAIVKALLDTTNGYAYLQNADTNKYIEDTFVKKAEVIDLKHGGTGRDLSTIEPYSIIRAASNSAYLLSTPTANGAFFATGDNKAAKFATLPIPQGGTGATTGAGALTNLGVKDYVVAEGTLNGWGYRKWNSGIGECWYNDSFATTAVSQTPVAYPYMFTQNFTFPFDFTNNKYTAVATVTHSNGHGIVTRINHASPNAITILWEGNVANSNAAMSIYVIGKY